MAAGWWCCLQLTKNSRMTESKNEEEYSKQICALSLSLYLRKKYKKIYLRKLSHLSSRRLWNTCVHTEHKKVIVLHLVFSEDHLFCVCVMCFPFISLDKKRK